MSEHQKRELITLRDLRKGNDFTQEQVATRLGISKSHYSMLENGVRRVTLPLALKIARLYSRPVESILFPVKTVHVGKTASS